MTKRKDRQSVLWSLGTCGRCMIAIWGSRWVARSILPREIEQIICEYATVRVRKVCFPLSTEQRRNFFREIYSGLSSLFKQFYTLRVAVDKINYTPRDTVGKVNFSATITTNLTQLIILVKDGKKSKFITAKICWETCQVMMRLWRIRKIIVCLFLKSRTNLYGDFLPSGRCEVLVVGYHQGWNRFRSRTLDKVIQESRVWSSLPTTRILCAGSRIQRGYLLVVLALFEFYFFLAYCKIHRIFQIFTFG